MRLVLSRRLRVVDSVERSIEIFGRHGIKPCLYFLELKLEISQFMLIDTPQNH